MTIEALTKNTPENTSIAQVGKFTFIIPDKPFLKYFCQTVQLPSVSTSEIAVPTPFATTYRHGEKLIYDPLVITAIMDEDFRVWTETYNWLKSLTRPTSYSEYPKKTKRDIQTPIYFDGFLTTNTNANNPNIRFKFRNCHPTSIGAVNFDTKNGADVIPTADFQFRYDYFEIEYLQ
jgi:hypothetical protein